MSGTASSSHAQADGVAGAPRENASHRHLHNEDLLWRTWRSIAQSVVQVTHKAEQHAKDPTNRDTSKELNEATILVLRGRLEWARCIAHIEATLEGKAEEMKVLQHFVRSAPRIGRKRKIIELETEEFIAGKDEAISGDVAAETTATTHEAPSAS